MLVDGSQMNQFVALEQQLARRLHIQRSLINELERGVQSGQSRDGQSRNPGNPRQVGLDIFDLTPERAEYFDDSVEDGESGFLYMDEDEENLAGAFNEAMVVDVMDWDRIRNRNNLGARPQPGAAQPSASIVITGASRNNRTNEPSMHTEARQETETAVEDKPCSSNLATPPSKKKKKNQQKELNMDDVRKQEDLPPTFRWIHLEILD